MLQVILIDDEPKALKGLEWELVNNCEGVEIQGTFTDPEEALVYLRNHRPDVVFLDIQMPEMDGFQFLEHFEQRSFSVVFVTAYDEYALKAIKENAKDYLLKPIDTEVLQETIQKLKFEKRQKPSIDILEEVLLEATPKRIAIPIDGKLLFFTPDEILYCESDGNYSRLFLTNQKTLFLSKKLKEMEDILPKKIFFRIHNSYIINLQKVREYLKKDYYVVLENGTKLPVSRYRKSNFLKKI